MSDIDPDLLFKQDRTYAEVLLDHLVREARYNPRDLRDTRRMVTIDRDELEHVMVTYCSRIRQELRAEIVKLQIEADHPKRPAPDNSGIGFGIQGEQ